MIRSSTIQAVLETLPNVSYVTPRIAIGIPPSDIDPVWDEMRVAVDGSVVLRAFDPGDGIITGAPIGMLTEGGDTLVTEAGDRIILEVLP